MTFTPTSPQELSPEVETEMEYIFDHINANHSDTVLFLAQIIGKSSNATDAEAISVDSLGADLRIIVDGTDSMTRIEFAGPVTSTPEIQGQLMSLVAQARATVDKDVPLTSLEQELSESASLPTFLSTVRSVTELTPNLKVLTLEGGLEEFTPLGADDFVYLMVNHQNNDTIIDDEFTMEKYQSMDEDKRPLGAYYTVRSYDQINKTMDIWVVIHGHGGGVSGWANEVKPGARLAIWGPRRSFQPASDTSDFLLVADESGLAAVAALLETLTGNQKATVIAETIDESHIIDLPAGPNIEVQWVFRHDAEPGTGTHLLDAIQALKLRPEAIDLTDDSSGSPVGAASKLAAFGAGESRQVTAIRKYLRRELGMPASQVFVSGYWRR